MPSDRTTLAWGVPVEVGILGAHLEAHFRTLSALNTLKLCTKFGKGKHVFVNKMPSELVLCVADHIIFEERSRRLPRWKLDFRCFQLLCDPDDHSVKSRWQRLKGKSSKGENLERINAHGGDVVLDTRVGTYSSEEELSDDETAKWVDVHGDRISRWQMRTSPPFGNPNTNPFMKYQNLIHKHLGLEIWVEEITMYNLRPQSWWARMDSTLPGKSNSHSTVAWLFSPFTESAGIENGFSLTAPSCSSSTRAKFDRALGILGLQPCLHKSQQGLLIEEDRVEWPKAICLKRRSQDCSFMIWGEQGRNDRY